VRTPLPRPRAGLTLIELLVVLALLAITATVVPVARRGTRATPGDARQAVVQDARRDAIRRGETLRLRIDTDGAWVLAARDGAAVLTTGRTAPGPAPVSLRIDPLGSCRPVGDRADEAADASAFDVLSCRAVPDGAAP
jgi:prepilin-type N-terminal cleavage/methylation domain-containing protein